MRISDKERRRAVAELREASTGAYRHVDALDVIAGSVGVEVAGKFGHEVENETYAALADLIDRPSTTRHGKFRTKYGRETPCCEVCGYSIGDMRWDYCPKCGAVITDD